VYVGEGAEELVDVELDFEYGHGGLHLVEVAGSAVDGLGDVLLDQVEVDLVLLRDAGRLVFCATDVWEGALTRSPFE
jgi:hypothetical protein